MTVFALDGIAPELPGDGDFWIAPDAAVSGRVVMESATSVWFGAVVRGDTEVIRVGRGSNVQDLCVLHTDHRFPLDIGAGCTIGHRAILHGCTIGDGSLIGMGAIILNGAKVGRNCLIGAGALVPEGREVPDGSLVIGAPGKVTRALSAEELERLTQSALNYQANMRRFRQGLSEAGG
jgi:carbonic anhydrase/acetyltransferase-like protein (isoleucine patch superfamily)